MKNSKDQYQFDTSSIIENSFGVSNNNQNLINATNINQNPSNNKISNKLNISMISG